ncbi:S-layer homology domain-containing protein [Cohnella sp. GCM10020058]|uniref:S-layer homology domain-containing protein n=1 Tax=Cohnella sp. GCM10020058 TaxID=3317330 RepID=UPI00362F25F1
MFVAIGAGGTILTSGDGASWTSRTSGLTTNIVGITYGDNLYVAVGNSGKIVTSSNGVTWTSRTSGISTSYILYGVAYGNGMYAAVGTSGVIITSNNGVNWTSQTSGYTGTLKDVAYGDGRFVALGDLGRTVFSNDGVLWRNSSTNTYTAVGISFDNGNFAAVGHNGAILTSSDGVSWTTRSSGTTLTLTNVTNGNGMYVVVGETTILTSTDGASWTSRMNGTTSNIYGVIYANGTYVAVSSGGTILTSGDGASWMSRMSGTPNVLYGIIYGDGQYVAVGQSGTIMTSNDGATWTSRTSGTTILLASVAYGNGINVAVGQSGLILTSIDGVNWVSRTSGTTNALTGVAFGNGKFVAVGASGTIVTSDDGMSWASRTSGTASLLKGVAFGKGTYVTVGVSGLIITSGNGTDWVKQTSGVTAQLNSVNFGNGMFEAVGNSGTVMTSGNGVSWTSRASGTASDLLGFTFGTATYVAVGLGGTIIQSGPVAPAISSVSVSPNKASVVQGGSKQLAAAVEAVDGAAETVTWTSSDAGGKVAVSGTGNVTVAADARPDDYTITATSTFDSSKKGTATITVTAAMLLETKPEAEIGYTAEELTGLVANGAYTVNGTAVTADGSGKVKIAGSWIGLTVNIVKKGNGTTTTDSLAQTLSVPARPAAPTAGKTDESTINGSNGALTNVLPTMEYKTASASSWTNVAGTSVTGLAPGTYNVRVKATSSSFVSAAQTVTISAFTATQESKPEAEIDYAAEQLSGLAASGAYTVNGTAVTADGSGKVQIDAGWLGTDVNVVKKGDGTTTTDSLAQTLSVPARPAAPTAGKTDESIINGSNGALTNVTSAMEYKIATASSWTSIIGTSVTGLAPGTYNVRVKATSSSFASAAQTVTISAFTATQEAQPEAEIDYAAEQLTGLAASGAYTVNGTAVTADGSGKVQIDAGWLGMDVNVVKKGNGTTTTDSLAQTLSVPARPAAPTAGKTDESTINSSNGTLTNVTSAMAYKQAAASSWTDITGTSVTGLAPGTYNVRVKATSSSFVSAAQTVTIAAFVATQEAQPEAEIDYAAEQLSGLAVNGAYTVNGTAVTADGSGKVQIDAGWLGTDVNLVKKGNGATTTDSFAQTLALPARPAAPVNLSVTDVTYNGANNGSILHVNLGMQFKEGTTGTWTSVTGTSVVGLAPGVYYVRLAATSSDFASIPAQVTIHDSDATLPEASNVSADDTGNVIVGLDTTMEFSVDGGAYVRYDGTNMPQLSGEHTVLVRVAASGSVPAGPATTLIFTTNMAVPAGGLTITAADPSGATNDGRTQITVTPLADDNHRMVYFNFGNGTVVVPNVGDTLSGYSNVPGDGMIPAANGDKIGVAEVDAQGQVVRFGQTAAIVIAEPAAPQPSNEVPTGTAGPKEESVDVLVNGKAESAGKAMTTESGGVKTTTVAVDPVKLQAKLASEGANAVVIIPVKSASNVIVGELTGRMVKNMESLSATLVLQTEKGTYTLPAKQINIDELAGKFGSGVKLEDIQLKVAIAQTSETMAKVVENAASKGEFSVILPAVDFTVSATYGGKTVEVTAFNVYVERMVALPDGIDPNRITTGVVVDADGTARHVPTKIVLVEGKYFAKINSLTNSTYAVVWHPLEFSDVANHWAKTAVNDMGSRMVIQGTGDGLFSPDRDITRAEFAAIIVRALGLKPDHEATPFSDVKTSDWYGDAVNTAYAYKLIAGFEDGTFRPNDKITREQAMAVLANAMKLTGLKDKLSVQAADAVLHPFADAASVSVWAQSGVADSVQAGIVAGRSAASLAPKANMTRAEVATIMQNLLQKSGLI